MDKRDNERVELENELADYKRTLRRHPDDSNTFYLIARTLQKIGKLTNENGYYEDALAHYSTAIKLNPSKADYHADRGRLYAIMGRSDEAMEDLNAGSQLLVDDGANNSLDAIYAKQTIYHILKLDNVKYQLKEYVKQGLVNTALAQVINDVVEVTDYLVIQVGAHAKILETLRLDIEQLNNLVDFIMERIITGEETASETILEIRNIITSIQQTKAGKTELEPHAFKVNAEISRNAKLNGYFGAIYSKLEAIFLEVNLICNASGYLSLDKSSTLISGVQGAANLIPFVGKAIGSSMKATQELMKSNKLKEKATTLSSVFLTPDAKHSILKKVSEKVTLDRKEFIKSVDESCQEIQDWMNRSLQDKLKFNVDIDKSAEQILGHLDAKKIQSFIKHNADVFENKNTEEMIDKLSEIPTHYKIVLDNIVGEYISKVKIVDRK